MGDRYYDLTTKSIVYSVPYADGEGERDPTLADAKKNGKNWAASVTTILGILDKGDGLQNWFAELHLDAARGLGQLLDSDHEKWKSVVKHKADLQRKKAPNLGVAIHAAFEDYFRYQIDPEYKVRSVERDVKPYVRALHKFALEHNMKPIVLESVVANAEVGYAGTMDLAVEFDGVASVGDYKSKACKNGKPWFADNFFMQMAAYAKADNVPPVSQMVSIIIDTKRHGTYSADDDLPPIHYRVKSNLDEWFSMFKSVAATYYEVKKWKR